MTSPAAGPWPGLSAAGNETPASSGFSPSAAHERALPPARSAAGRTRVRAGLPYAALPGSRPLELDLWLPPEHPEPAPVALFLHGGGWQSGSRHQTGPALAGMRPSPFERAARAGIAVASADYRLSGEARWPAQLHDAKAAVRWLRARASELGIDPRRIAAWGESAGGHLAALLGLTADDHALEGEIGVTGPSSAVCGVIAWYAPTDLSAAAAGPARRDTPEARLLGSEPAAVPGIARQASPVSHVTPAAPPFLLLHGAADRLVPWQQSQRLHQALAAAGCTAELTVYDGAGHMWLDSPQARDLALRRTIGTLRRWFSEDPQPSGAGQPTPSNATPLFDTVSHMTGHAGETIPAQDGPVLHDGQPSRDRQSTADKTLDILLMFGEQRLVVRAIDVARQLGVARSTAYRYLQSLTQSGFIEEIEAGGYRLGQRVLKLALLARRSMELPAAARPVMRELAAEVGEVVLLTRTAGAAAICLERADGSTREFGISYEPGQPLPLNAGASAYALLAWLPETEAQELLSSANMRRFTDRTLVRVDSLMQRFAEIRDQGYAVSRGELAPDVLGVAAPIRAEGGRTVAAISIVAMASLVSDDRVPALADAVRNAADEISAQLAAQAAQ